MRFLRGIAILIFVAGVITLVYYQFSYDTSVSYTTESISIGDFYVPSKSGRVHNLGRLSDKESGITLGGIVIVVGLILFGISFLTKNKAMQQASVNETKAKQSVETVTDSTNSVVDQLEKLAALKDKGVLTEDEFKREKARILQYSSSA
jgi:hypothetical protein